MFIIPAIDIIAGKCVRLSQGDYTQVTEYHADPLDIARQFEDAGLQRLHLVDLDGARSARIVNYRVLERIASYTNLHIDFGGGIKSDDDARIAFECGAQQITGGTIAVTHRELFMGWITRYGSERIILGADVKDGKVAISGWQEQSALDLDPFLHDYQQLGVQYAICTDISKDGLLQGSAIELYQHLRASFPDLKLIASGGISSIDELARLRELGCYGAIVGKALYEGRISLKDLLMC
jgi:phosphoribosylformimino-5-aminoimidazole carboxamide ribotide isomerase